MKLCLTGDLFLGGDLLDKNVDSIINIDLFNLADKRIVNLEQPISDNDKVEDKCTLFTGSSAIEQLKIIKVDAVNLAHNHIQDKGLDAIFETVEHLSSANIYGFGAGSTISEAKKPYRISDTVLLFGYCESNNKYLKQIAIANETTPGINPLRYDSILSDLSTLKEDQKAILYFHWGREHVFFPSHSNIELARKLLEDERVLLIVGMHPHRLQGYIEHKGKRAYMSLGNFLFPNFYIKPPTQIYYPEKPIENIDVTRQYHGVFKNTYKKWKLINRISIVLEYDTFKKRVIHKLSFQNDDEPHVSELTGFREFYYSSLIELLSLLYKLPKFIYTPIEKLNSFITYLLWNTQIYLFLLKQKGIRFFISKVKKRLTNKKQ